VAVSHTVSQVSTDSGHNLGQYMSIKRNLLYVTWAARPGVYIDTKQSKGKVVPVLN
jgi:hypothetical protein